MDFIECPYCRSNKIVKKGIRSSKKGVIQRLFCNNCNREFSKLKDEVNLNEKINTGKIYEQGDNFINVICASTRMLSKEDIIKEFNIDLEVWEIERFKVKTSEGYRKDRKVEWDVKDGVVERGHVRDSGKLLIAPLYHIEVRFRRKVKEIELRDIKDLMIKEMKKFAPEYKTIKYNKIKDKFLLEPDIPDLHFGKLAWSEESGEDFDIKIAEELALNSLQSLINQSSIYSIDRILFPIGNDYFNVNNKLNVTIHNTPQQEDTRWQKTFVKGRLLAIKMIDMLASVAPVDVVIVPGNHDEERTFYLGDALECWYHNNKNVNINNQAVKRKYYLYGKNLIGFTHGYYEKLDKLPLLMSLEQPKWWAQSKFREWQTGDKHHKREIKTSLKVDESTGVMVRILSSLTAKDAWTFDKGFVGAQRASEAFVRHYTNGLIAQFVSSL